jgi:hypothetical protein
VSPGIETTSGDGQQPAHYPDVKFLTVFFDEHESYRLSGAKEDGDAQLTLLFLGFRVLAAV